MIGPMLFSLLKATLMLLIERIESIFVDSVMIELDLNDHKSEFTKAVILKFGHISITCHGLGPLAIFDRRLNSIKYIDILETYLPTAFQKYPPTQLPKIFYQHDNAHLHVSTMTKNYLKRKRIEQIIWPANSPYMNIIENIWSIIDNKLLKFTINNVDELINALQTAWIDISKETVEKLFESLPQCVRKVKVFLVIHKYLFFV